MSLPALVVLLCAGPVALGLPAGLLVGASVLVVVAAVVVAVRARRRAAEARAAAAAAERKGRLLLALLERDRLRLAQRLHDGPIQDLLAHEMVAGVVAHLGGDDPPEDDLAGVVRDLRAVSEGLRPPALDAFGLAAAVSAHADRFQARHPRIEVALDLDPVDLGPHVRLALFRVVQEGLHNAALHGPPLRIEVTLRARPGGAAELLVVDDGQGYEVPEDVTEFAASGRYGVLGMLVHAEAVGASLRLESAPGRTAVRVVAPASAPPLP